MKLIGFTGRAGAGKDTAAEVLIIKHRAHHFSMAARLKAMLQVGLDLHPFDYKTPEQKAALIPWLGRSYRDLAQTLGTEWGRAQHPQLWVLLAERDIAQRLKTQHVVITDIRFENEAEMVYRLSGTLVHVKRAGEVHLNAEQQAHASERGLPVGPYDRVIQNNYGVDVLHNEVESIFFTTPEVA
jgi:hypothetical protein